MVIDLVSWYYEGTIPGSLLEGNSMSNHAEHCVCGGRLDQAMKCLDCGRTQTQEEVEGLPQPIIIGPNVSADVAVRGPFGSQIQEGQPHLIYSMVLSTQSDVKVGQRLVLRTACLPMMIPACSIIGAKEAMRARLLEDFDNLWAQIETQTIAIVATPSPAPEPDWHTEKMRMASEFEKRRFLPPDPGMQGGKLV